MKIRTLLIALLTVVTLFSFSAYSQELHLYGGADQDVYLGCLTCNNYGSKSIWNEYSDYGNSYSSKSIWNDYGDYGSEYSSYSPWNSYGSYPPIVVDKNGKFYGYFTVDKYKRNRAEFELALLLYKYFEFIRDDVGKWYKKIFEE